MTDAETAWNDRLENEAADRIYGPCPNWPDCGCEHCHEGHKAEGEFNDFCQDCGEQRGVKMMIAEKNDLMRKTFVRCRVVMTPGVANLSPEYQSKVIEAVQKFDEFNQDNDPHQEHDFGKVVVNGTDYFFKFDYYDDKYEFFKEDGNRVLTIMRADEY